MASVFVTRALPGDALARLRGAHQVKVWDGPMPPEPAVLREAVADAEGLLCLLTERIDAALLDAAPRVGAIANYAVGTDNIDLRLTRARGIPVGVTPDVLTEATADLAFALLLAAARRLPEAAAAARDGKWRTWEPAHWLGAEVNGAGPGGAAPRRGRGGGARGSAGSEWGGGGPPPRWGGPEVNGATLGIVGFGRIGRA